MKTIKIVWTDIENVYERHLENVAEGLQLIEQLEKVRSSIPPMVEFSLPNCEVSLTLGVGRNRTVLTFNESLNPPYYISVGDLSQTGVITFCWGNQETEYLARNSVAVSEGKKAVTSFLETFTKPDNLVWETL